MTAKSDDEQGFLSRWSRRKLEEPEPEAEAPETEVKAEPVDDDNQDVEQIDSDEKDRPIWQQKDADPDMKKQALTALFKQPEFNERDGLNEYDEDYTTFPSLGKVVTQEMKRMIKLAEEKTRPDTDLQQEKSQQGGDDETPNVADKNNNNDEDNKLA